MVCGVWCAVCGVWCVVCGDRSGPLRAKLLRRITFSVYMYMYIYICARIYISHSLDICMCVYIYISVYIYIYIYLPSYRAAPHTAYIYLYMCIYVNTYISLYVYMCIYVGTLLYIKRLTDVVLQTEIHTSHSDTSSINHLVMRERANSLNSSVVSRSVSGPSSEYSRQTLFGI